MATSRPSASASNSHSAGWPSKITSRPAGARSRREHGRPAVEVVEPDERAAPGVEEVGGPVELVRRVEDVGLDPAGGRAGRRGQAGGELEHPRADVDARSPRARPRFQSDSVSRPPAHWRWIARAVPRSARASGDRRAGRARPGTGSSRRPGSARPPRRTSPRSARRPRPRRPDWRHASPAGRRPRRRSPGGRSGSRVGVGIGVGVGVGATIASGSVTGPGRLASRPESSAGYHPAMTDRTALPDAGPRRRSPPPAIAASRRPDGARVERRGVGALPGNRDAPAPPDDRRPARRRRLPVRPRPGRPAVRLAEAARAARRPPDDAAGRRRGAGRRPATSATRSRRSGRRPPGR